MENNKPTLYTIVSPSLLHLYHVPNTIVVVIDVFRATSTIASAMHNGAQKIIPVDSVAGAIEIGLEVNGITAGERDGKVADGLSHGNSPLEYPPAFIQDRILVLTTTNGTRLLHMALKMGAETVITGAFANLSAVCDFITASGKNVLLCCAGWKDRVNMEDTLFAGAVVQRLKNKLHIDCDASLAAAALYAAAANNMWDFIQETTHFNRLSNYGLQEDIQWCLNIDGAPVLPIYKAGALVKG